MDSLDLHPLGRVFLGDVTAENDRNLRSAYVPNEHWDLAQEFTSQKFYFIGKKGFGKSALLEMIRLTKLKDHIVDLGNQDIGLSLLSLTNDLSRWPESAQRLIFRAAWLASLMCSIRGHIGGGKSGWSRTPAQKALDEVDSALRPASSGIAGIVAKAIDTASAKLAAGGLEISVDLKANQNQSAGIVAKADLIHKINLASEHFRDLIASKETFVLLDDLDQSWTNDTRQNLYLAALFEAIEKLARIPTLKFIVSLRVDIFRALPLENLDKVVQHIHRLQWSPQLLRRIVVNRLGNALKEPEPRFLRRFTLRKQGDPIDLILRGCFPHPRDAIWTFQQLLDNAADEGRSHIDQTMIDRVNQLAAGDRVAWLCGEWKHVFPWLHEAIRAFTGGANEYSWDALNGRLAEVAKRVPIDRLVAALLSSAVLGLKFKKSEDARYYMATDPPPAPYGNNCFFEIHPAVRSVVQSGRWNCGTPD